MQKVITMYNDDSNWITEIFFPTPLPKERVTVFNRLVSLAAVAGKEKAKPFQDES